MPKAFLSREFLSQSAKDLWPGATASEKDITIEIGTEGVLKDKVCRPITSERLRDGSAGLSGHKHRYRRVSAERNRMATLVRQEKGELPKDPVFNTHGPIPYDAESLKFKSVSKTRTFQRFKPTHPEFPLSTSRGESSSSGLARKQSEHCSRSGSPIYVHPLNPVGSLASRQGPPSGYDHLDVTKMKTSGRRYRAITQGWHPVCS